MKNRLIPLSFCLLLGGCVYPEQPQSDIFMQSELLPPKEASIDIAPQMQPPVVAPQIQPVVAQPILAAQPQNPTPFVQTIVIPQAAPMAYPTPVNMPNTYQAPMGQNMGQMQAPYQAQPMFQQAPQNNYNMAQQMPQQMPQFNQDMPNQLQPASQLKPQMEVPLFDLAESKPLPQIEVKEEQNIYPSWARPHTPKQKEEDVVSWGDEKEILNQTNIPRW